MLPRDGTVRVSAAGIAFDLDGAEHRRLWEEIASIRLRVDPQGGVETGICALGFRGGPGVLIRTGTRLGVHDAGRADAYRAFVAALHAALPAEAHGRIAFLRGNTAGAQMVQTASNWAFGLIVGGALLFILAQGTDLPWARIGVVFGAAALLVWFAERRTGRLAPGSYDPAAVPDDLLPR
ncbi:hypothetical protein [Elioraea sp.]|uniref:hypothetical protein n=1 Tax=Elioraea sp. TaxID=2185103 RepID=UPI003F719BB1